MEKKIQYKSEKYNWNMYYVSNEKLFGKRRNAFHPFLVIDEINGNLFGFIVTHSKEVKNKPMAEIANIDTKDIDKITKMKRKSFIVLDPVYKNFIDDSKPLTEKDLLKKVNDVKFNQTSLIKMLEYFNSDPKILKKYNAFLEENKKT